MTNSACESQTCHVQLPSITHSIIRSVNVLVNKTKRQTNKHCTRLYHYIFNFEGCETHSFNFTYTARPDIIALQDTLMEAEIFLKNSKTLGALRENR